MLLTLLISQKYNRNRELFEGRLQKRQHYEDVMPPFYLLN